MNVTDHPPLDYLAPVRGAVLEAALAHVPFDGWSETVLQNAMRDAGVDAGRALLAFPGGAIDLVDAFWVDNDMALAKKIAESGLHSSHVSQRISKALEIYLGLLRPHREAVRRALALQALPQHAPGALAMLYRTVDTIWRSVDDQSTDYNFYTKRAVLAAVVISVVTQWLGGDGDDAVAMKAFIERRIGNVLAFEKVKARVAGMIQSLPSPAPLLGRLAGRMTGIRHSL